MKVTVPVEVLVRVTEMAPEVMGFSFGWRRCMVMVPDGTPAMVVIGEVVKTSLFACTVTVCVALVNGELAAVMVGVPDFVSVKVKVALLDPLGMVNEDGTNVVVPVELLERLTVMLPVVIGVLSGSCRCTVIVPVAVPIMVVIGELVNTSLDCNTVSPWVALVISGLAAVRVGVPAAVSV